MTGQIMILICLVLASQVSGLETNHWGTHFVLSFITIESQNTVKNIVVITARSKTDVRVVFHQTGAEERFWITSGNSQRVEFDQEVTPTTYTTVLSKMAISVESLKPVSVYAYVYNQEKSEGFLVLPVASLGTKYITVTYEHSTQIDVPWCTQIIILATENDTEVEVKLHDDNECLIVDSWTVLDNESKRRLNFKMDAYDVVNIMCNKDTTGSSIEAKKPVAVLSGANPISFGTASQYHPIVEMIPPITELGEEYTFITPHGHTHDSMVRVVALKSNTEFTFNGENYLNDSGDHIDISLSQNESVCFNSNKPVLVALFMTGEAIWKNKDKDYTGNAFMSIIPPVSRFTWNYLVPTSALNTYDAQFVNRVDVIVHKYSTNPSHYKYDNICGDYFVTHFNYSGVIYFHASSPFMVLVYGYADKDGYGFPAGMKLTDFSGQNECLSSPCQNGGWCLEVGLSFRCYCQDSRYTGFYCETDLGDQVLNALFFLPTSITLKPCNQTSTVAVPTLYTTQTMVSQETQSTPAPTPEASPTEQMPILKTETPSTNPPTETDTVKWLTIVTTQNAFSEKQITIIGNNPTTEQHSVTSADTKSTEHVISTEQPTTTAEAQLPQRPNTTAETPEQRTTDAYQPPESSSGTTQISTQYTITSPYNPSNPPVIYGNNPNTKSYSNKWSYMCSCPCKKSLNSSQILESNKQLNEALTLDKTTLSKTFRKKHCSKNLKILEENIGQSSFIIVMLPFLCLVLSDLCKIPSWWFSRRRRRAEMQKLIL